MSDEIEFAEWVCRRGHTVNAPAEALEVDCGSCGRDAAYKGTTIMRRRDLFPSWDQSEAGGGGRHVSQRATGENDGQGFVDDRRSRSGRPGNGSGRREGQEVLMPATKKSTGRRKSTGAKKTTAARARVRTSSNKAASKSTTAKVAVKGPAKSTAKTTAKPASRNAPSLDTVGRKMLEAQVLLDKAREGNAEDARLLGNKIFQAYHQARRLWKDLDAKAAA